MFVTRRNFDARVAYLESEIADLRDKHWEVCRAHWRLLEKLGLHEVELPAKKVIREKGGPEESE